MLSHMVNGIIGPLHMSVKEVKDSQYKISPALVTENGILPLSELVGFNLQIEQTGKFHCKECLHEYVSEIGKCCDICLNPLVSDDSSPHIIYLALSQNVFIGNVPVLDAKSSWEKMGASQVIPVARASSQSIAREVVVKSGLRTADKVKPIEYIIGARNDIDLSKYETSVKDLIKEQYNQYECSPVASLKRHYGHLLPKNANRTKLSLSDGIEGIFIGVVGDLLLLDCGYIDLIQLSGAEANIKFTQKQ